MPKMNNNQVNATAQALLGHEELWIGANHRIYAQKMANAANRCGYLANGLDPVKACDCVAMFFYDWARGLVADSAYDRFMHYSSNRNMAVSIAENLPNARPDLFGPDAPDHVKALAKVRADAEAKTSKDRREASIAQFMPEKMPRPSRKAFVQMLEKYGLKLASIRVSKIYAEDLERFGSLEKLAQIEWCKDYVIVEGIRYSVKGFGVAVLGVALDYIPLVSEDNFYERMLGNLKMWRESHKDTEPAQADDEAEQALANLREAVANLVKVSDKVSPDKLARLLETAGALRA